MTVSFRTRRLAAASMARRTSSTGQAGSGTGRASASSDTPCGSGSGCLTSAASPRGSRPSHRPRRRRCSGSAASSADPDRRFRRGAARRPRPADRRGASAAVVPTGSGTVPPIRLWLSLAARGRRVDIRPRHSVPVSSSVAPGVSSRYLPRTTMGRSASITGISAGSVSYSSTPFAPNLDVAQQGVPPRSGGSARPPGRPRPRPVTMKGSPSPARASASIR